MHSRISEYERYVGKERLELLKERRSDELQNVDKFLGDLLKSVRDEILKNNFFILTPLRGSVPLDAEVKIASDVSPFGRGILQALAHAFIYYDPKVRHELSSMLASWAERFGVRDLTAGVDKDGRVRATFEDLKARIDLAMGSHGQRQLLTLLTQLIVAPPHSLVMIEEPEISLHPKAQALLPLLFADVIRKHEKQVIVTTHSSILVLALSDAVMGSDEYPSVPKLSVDDIAVYHVIRDEEGYTRVEPLELTKEGFVKGGIPSFVDVEAKLYGKILSRLS